MTIRVITDPDGLSHETRIQQLLVRAAVVFRADTERELARMVKDGGFSVADQATATTAVLAAVKAVLW